MLDRARMDHACFTVADVDWYLKFFEEAFGFEITKSIPEAGKYWLDGGMQINKGDVKADKPQGMDHVGLGVRDLEEAYAKVYAFPEVKELPQGRQWVQLPEGEVLELCLRDF